jgi:polyribonucleotide nucleotidyltransferase
MEEKSISIELAPGKEIKISTGKLAKLANASAVLSMGDTRLLVAVCDSAPREGTDFFPLQVDYREKFSAAGLFPGGYMKREGRPSTKEILTCRMTDRPIRPLFPKGYFDEVQVQALVLSADGENDPDVLCMLGASVVLMLSDLPFQGPIGALRVGYVDGEFIANPTHSEMAKSEFELVYAGIEDKVIMIEGEAKIVPEELLQDAMKFANEIVKKQLQAQKELQAIAGKAKKTPTLRITPEDMMNDMKELSSGKIADIIAIQGKEERGQALSGLYAEVKEAIASKYEDIDDCEFLMNIGWDEIVEIETRALLLNGVRAGGRATDELREINCEAGVLPVVHGSGLFERGETQALVIATLGGARDTQDCEMITAGGAVKSQKFYLHYNFPNYSVGETGRIMGPGRREIGHGNLAERAVAQVIPEDFDYTVRCVSEVLGSNGSTSMASVCGATLSLMDAGVPIKAPVAGITCGLCTAPEGEEAGAVLLTDILGSEDHFGDMDFKVCGTREGVTAFQLDLKLPGISLELLFKAMEDTKKNRLKIIDYIEGEILAPREEISANAPQMKVIKIKTDKIGGLIGPGGKNIKALTEDAGVNIDITDDGTVKIFAPSKEKLNEVLEKVELATAEPEVGKIYRGTVKGIKDFGAFVEILPGIDGLLHISELADYRVQNVTDICKEGEKVTVKCIEIDRGRIKLSRKAALSELDK